MTLTVQMEVNARNVLLRGRGKVVQRFLSTSDPWSALKNFFHGMRCAYWDSKALNSCIVASVMLIIFQSHQKALYSVLFSYFIALGGLNARKVPRETAINHKWPPSDTWNGGHGSWNCHSWLQNFWSDACIKTALTLPVPGISNLTRGFSTHKGK